LGDRQPKTMTVRPLSGGGNVEDPKDWAYGFTCKFDEKTGDGGKTSKTIDDADQPDKAMTQRNEVKKHNTIKGERTR